MHELPPSQPSEQPQLESDFQSVDSRWIRLEQISGLILSAILLIGSLVGLGFVWFQIGAGWVLYASAIGAGVLIVILVAFSILWPRLAFRHIRWRLDHAGLEIRLGVLRRHAVSVPLGRVQHADVTQGPLQRWFGIGKLTIYTAGTRNSSVELSGLTHEMAMQLRDRLVNQGKSNEVV